MAKIYPPKLFCCENPLYVVKKNNLRKMKLSFNKSVTENVVVNTGDIKQDNETLLRFYAFYKRLTEGDIYQKHAENCFEGYEKAWYDAWVSLKGKSIENAQTEFVRLVSELKI